MIDVLESLNSSLKENIPVVLITIINSVGSSPGRIGFKMLAGKNGRIIGTIGGGGVEFYALQKCKELLNSDLVSLTQTISLNETDDNSLVNEIIKQDDKKIIINALCGGEITLLFEIFKPAKSLYIFGAGHVGKSIAHLAKYLNYHVTLIDDREDILTDIDEKDYDKSEKINLEEIHLLKNEIKLIPGSFAVVVTRNHINDFNVLKYLYSNHFDLIYIGLIGSKKKVKESVARLKDILGPEIELNNLFAPIGLNIGGNTPEEIALGVMAEILSISYNKENVHNTLNFDE